MTINDQRHKRPNVFDVGIANIWQCDLCKANGPANFVKDETIAGAVAKIRAAHAQVSPGCNGETRYIRLVNFDRLKGKGRVA